MNAPDGQRIDKWLWHARFVRTRTGAQRLIDEGSLRVNRDKVEASSRLVRPGDVLTIALGRAIRVVHVLALADRRGSAEQAALLYRDHETDRRDGGAEPSEGL
ncbi:RNA-binding S4 domain-containing protein [Faunimonas sp. B44]|uniref:RNA-binding S4 domain-containing protein n=1 Tax=Faunimonas sp. B44 TaxID=3461493 RepID=UPI004044103E